METVYILISWAPVLLCGAAERDYFTHDWRNVTWDEARTHCQECFNELVTLTPENIQTISRTLTSECWVGLRKKLTRNSSLFWSRWANGEPLTFQNWYPGRPVFKPPSPGGCCCDCDSPATTAAADVTGFVSASYDPLTEAATAMPEIAVFIRDSDDGSYIEDSCVAMLSFGAWVEKDCSRRLSFICYDDRFDGPVNVNQTSSESILLTWSPGPGRVSHYRIEVKTDKERIQIRTDSLTYTIVNLTAGTHYSVQVFPVKCMRDLNPQGIDLYTKPYKVENLTVTNVTETSVFLRWNKPAGNVDFYLIEVQGGGQIQSTTEAKEVGSLTPGTLHTFTVRSGVWDNSTWSEESNITQYTTPGRVSDLRVSENTNDSMVLNWVPPEGEVSGYRVKATMDSDDVLFDKNVTGTQEKVTGLPMGTEVTLRVAALTAGNTLEGDGVTVVNYTAPGLISGLTLLTSYHSLNASWTSYGGNSFVVELQTDGENVETALNLTEPWKHFDGLKTAANYTVTVTVYSGHLRGMSVDCTNFTRPSEPTQVVVVSSDKNQITLEWKAPDNLGTAKYSVRISSRFWGHSWSATVENKPTNRYMFGDLKSGTKYEFEVRTVVNGESSPPARESHYTDAEKREITLSMLCSSAKPLLCDDVATRESVLTQTRDHFNKLLGKDIFWELEGL